VAGADLSPPGATRLAAEATVAGLWRAYELTGDAEFLLLHYWPLVGRTAGRVGGDLPSFVDRADLVSYGTFGLIDAITKFDRHRGVKFETYASLRIRGAILDGLRSIDWVPRSVRARIRGVARAEGALQTTLNRSPTEDEVAAAIGITVASLRKRSAEAVLSTVVALDDARHAPSLERAESACARSGDARTDQPGHALEVAERQRAIAGAIEGLCDRDRTVIDLYYYRGLKLTEIGRMLGVTEARVSQLHTRARTALRKTLLTMDL
jgi:RNA polymerase sigma factor for flagellar operon FliA